MFYIYANGESIYDPTVESFYLFEPKLKLEFGKAGSLEFTIPSTNLYFNKLRQLKTVVSVELDDEEIFRGRVLSIETDMQNFHKVYCEGDLSYLVDSVYKGVAYIGNTHDLFNKIIAAHNKMVEPYKRFTVGNVTIENRPVYIRGKSDGSQQSINAGYIDYKQIALDSIADEWNNSFDYIQTCLIDYTGGYLKTRREGNTTYIDLLEKYDGSTTQEIVFGENMLDLTQEVSAEDLFTVLIPLGDENLTVAAVNGGSIELEDPNAVAQYGRIVRTHVFSNVRSPATLLEDGKRYLATNVNIPVSITVKAVDMHLVDDTIDMIKIGTRVHLRAPVHGIVEYLTCTEIEYDLGNPANNTYTFGNPKQTLTQRYREDWRIQNSGDGGAGGAGAAAEAAEEENEKKQKELEGRVYGELLDIDPDNPDGKVSLKAFFQDYKNGKKILEQEVGIDFDAEGTGGNGNVNLHTLRTAIDDQGREVQRGLAELRQDVTDEQSAMNLRVEHLVDLNDENSKKIAELGVRADDQGSTIYGLAERIDLKAEASDLALTNQNLSDTRLSLSRKFGIDVDATTGVVNIGTLAQTVKKQGDKIEVISENYAGMKQYVDDEVAEVSLVAQNANNAAAELKLTAKEQKTTLQALNVDVIDLGTSLVDIQGTLKAVNAEINNLKAKEITADQIAAKLGNISTLRVNTLIASSLFTGSYSEENRVVTGRTLVSNLNYLGKSGHPGNNHAHTITENDDGTITLGYACSEPQSFNIKATKTYKEGVAAAERAANIKTIRIDYYETNPITYNSDTNKYTIKLTATAVNKNNEDIYTLQSRSFTFDASDAYQAGLDDGNAGDEEAIAAAVKNVSLRDVTSIVSSSQSYDQVTISNERATRTANGYLQGNVRVFLSNGNNYDVVVGIADTKAFDAGKASVRTIQVHTPGSDIYPDLKETFNSQNGTTTIQIKARAVENNEESVTTLYTTGAAAYEAGQTKAQQEWQNYVVVNKPIQVSDSRNDNLETHYTTLNVRGSATYNKTTKYSDETELKIYCLSHYTAGETAGKNSVDFKSLTEVSWDAQYNNAITFTDTDTNHGTVYYSGGILRGRALLTLNGNNKTRYIRVNMPGNQAYNAGKALAGLSSVSGTSYDSSTKLTANVTNIDEVVSSSNKKTVYACFNINTNDGKTAVYKIGINATDSYNAGKTAGETSGGNAVKVDAVSGANYDNKSTLTAMIGSSQVGDYQSSYLFGKVKITLSSGKNPVYALIKMHGKKAYDAGKALAGLSSVSGTSYDSSTKLTASVTNIDEIVTSSNKKTVYACFNINTNDGKTAVYKIGINATDSYDAGKAAGRTQGQNDVYSQLVQVNQWTEYYMYNEQTGQYVFEKDPLYKFKSW